jgi:hypothetical protein
MTDSPTARLHLPRDVAIRGGDVLRRSGRRARSHCRFALPLIRFIPESLTYSAPLFLKRQCDRTLGLRQPRRGPRRPLVLHAGRVRVRRRGLLGALRHGAQPAAAAAAARDVHGRRGQVHDRGLQLPRWGGEGHTQPRRRRDLLVVPGRGWRRRGHQQRVPVHERRGRFLRPRASHSLTPRRVVWTAVCAPIL